MRWDLFKDDLIIPHEKLNVICYFLADWRAPIRTQKIKVHVKPRAASFIYESNNCYIKCNHIVDDSWLMPAARGLFAISIRIKLENQM